METPAEQVESHLQHAVRHVEGLVLAIASRDHGLAEAHCTDAIEDLKWVRRGIRQRMAAER